jgi:hypothetical protein
MLKEPDALTPCPMARKPYGIGCSRRPGRHT